MFVPAPALNRPAFEIEKDYGTSVVFHVFSEDAMDSTKSMLSRSEFCRKYIIPALPMRKGCMTAAERRMYEYALTLQ